MKRSWHAGLLKCPSKANPVRWIVESGRPDLNNRWWDNELWKSGYSAYSFPAGSSYIRHVNNVDWYAYKVKLSLHDSGKEAMFVDAEVDPEWTSSFPWLQQTNHWSSADGAPFGGNCVFVSGNAQWIQHDLSVWVRPATVVRAVAGSRGPSKRPASAHNVA